MAINKKIHPLQLAPNYIAILPAGLIAAAVSAPILNNLNYPDGEGLYRILANICHQDFFRSFSISGHPCGLCARCLGGYTGMLAGLLIVNLQKTLQIIRMLVLYCIGSTALLFAILDALVKFGDSNVYRFVSGSVGGFGFGLMLMVGTTFYLLRKK